MCVQTGDTQPESFMFQTIIDVDDREYVDKAIEKARGAELL